MLTTDLKAVVVRKINGVSIFFWLLFLAVLLISVLFLRLSTSGLTYFSGNEASHLNTVESLYMRGSFIIDYASASHMDSSYTGADFLSNKPPGYPLLLLFCAMPLIYVSNAVHIPVLTVSVAYLLNVFLACIVFLLVYRLCKAFSLSETVSVISAEYVIFGCLTIVLVSVSMSHLLSSLLILSAVYLSFGKGRGSLALGASSLCLGYSIAVDYVNALAVLGIAPSILPRIIADRKVAAMSSVLFAIPLAGLLAYNVHYFGTPFESGYSNYFPPEHISYDRDAGLMAAPNPGVFYGMFFSGSRGIFVYSPLFLLAVPGFFLISKKARLKAAALASPILMTAMFLSMYSFWHGGHFLGLRHMAHLFPLFGVLAAPALEEALKHGKWFVYVIYGAIALSFLVHILLLFGYSPETAWFVWDSYSDTHRSLYAEVLPYILSR